MLVTDSDNSTPTFLDIFKKKFSNFASKAPVLILFSATLDGVLVEEKGSNKSNYFKFDHTKTVKQNIKFIKDWLVENTYPIMIQENKVYGNYTSDEMDQLIEQGIPAEQVVLMKKETIHLVKHRIEKVIVKKDELFVTNLDTGKQFRYKLSIPSTILLRNLRGNWTAKYTYEVFTKKSQVLNEIYPNLDIGEDDN